MELAVSAGIDVAREMTWGNGYVLTCPECGATTGWQLRVGTYSD